ISAVFQRMWIVILCGVLCAGAFFTLAKGFVSPQYSSSVMLYVNNSSISVGNAKFSISSAELDAAQKLINTYIVVLKNRTTLEEIINKAEVDYTYTQLSNMITASSVEETEIFSVTVTSKDPVEAAKIANVIATVLPDRTAEIIDGSSMRIVETAVVHNNRVSPSYTRYVVLGFLIGAIGAALVIIIIALLDDVIHGEDYLTSTYDIPILAKIPEFSSSGGSKYRSYYTYGYGYGGYGKSHKNKEENK
ncbi:MAG: hypothetical protein KBS41_01445, partial [Oscillospiraceae bacterium]|nr:hypothetical protein [Candidatus Equicaccousia limihippi]